MTLIAADFEETEYRGPLFNQLATNQFILVTQDVRGRYGSEGE